MQFRSNDHWGALLIPRLVKLAHERMLIGIDREHREANDQLTKGRIGTAVPRTGNSERLSKEMSAQGS